MKVSITNDGLNSIKHLLNSYNQLIIRSDCEEWECNFFGFLAESFAYEDFCLLRKVGVSDWTFVEMLTMEDYRERGKNMIFEIEFVVDYLAELFSENQLKLF